MTTKRSMIEHKFDNIFDSCIGIYWQGNDNYPPLILRDESTLAEKIYCQRYSFSEPNIPKERHDLAEDCLAALRKFIFADCQNNRYQISIGHSAEIPNKIRSYKGILSKKANQGTFIEIEVPVENKTVMEGIINLSEENCNENLAKI